jgi:hypothetical protein
MTITASVGSKQGINALKNGVQIGGTTIYTGSGSPAGVYVALRIGDIYIDYTNGIQYMAMATGTGGWTAVTAQYGTIRLPAAGALPRATNGPTVASPAETSTNKINYQYLDFDPDTAQYCQWQFSMPHDYDGGTITAIVKWGAGSGTGNVIWAVQGVAIGDSVALDSAFGTAIKVTDTLVATANLHVSGSTAAITIAGTPAADKWTVIQLYRDAAAGGDTFTANARLIEVILTYSKLAS